MDIVNALITTKKPKRLYLTVRDPRAGTSKTVTIHGERLTSKRVIAMVLKAIRANHRKAG